MADQQQKHLKKIVIVGGGSAGWMTAAALSSLLPTGSASVTLIESDKIGTVGVGEATIPDMINFNALLGINEAEFLKATNGTFKLGIEFIDWGKKGESYLHPFGQHGVDMQGIDFHQYWLHSKANGENVALQNYSLCAVAAEQNKFSLPNPNPKSVLSHLRYAYHIDATLYAKYLRNYAEQRNVSRVDSSIAQALEPSSLKKLSEFLFEIGRIGSPVTRRKQSRQKDLGRFYLTQKPPQNQRVGNGASLRNIALEMVIFIPVNI